MASSKFASLTDAQKAASRQRLATKLGREYQGYKPGGDPRAAQRAVMATANRPIPPIPSGGAAAPVSGMGGAGGTQQMIKNGGMTKGGRRDGCAIRGKTRA